VKTLVVYDSFFGNTEKVAQAVGEALSGAGEVEIVRAGKVTPGQVAEADLVIVGSPTRAFRPSPEIGKFLRSIPAGGLEGKRTGAFDTRISEEDVGSAFLRLLMKVFGYAARPVSRKLERKGGRVVLEPAGFVVTGKEGPLKEGELDRAAGWARKAGEAG
jgi:flavodoxin